MRHPRYSLPSERPILGGGSVLLRSGWRLLAVLSLPSLGGYIWRGFIFGDWGWGIVGLLIASGFAFAAWHGLHTRTTECNGHVYHRFEHPVRYWFTIAIWFLLYLMSLGAFFFAHTPPDGPVHR